MKPSHDQHNDFFAHRPLPGVAFEHNDAVEIIGGEHAGDSGAIISLEELGESPAYLVELASGQDAVIGQPFLRLAGA
jgi:hypothetical protein